MKAVAVFPASRRTRLIDHPEPTMARPTDVKVKVLEVGICGTDKEICGFHYGTPPEGSDHLVIGHESYGEVVEVGRGVTAVTPGDRVVITVRRPCGKPECLACAQGRQDFCYTGEFTERGIKQRHGFMTEYVVDDQEYMVKVPPEIADLAILVEPLTIAEKALLQVWQVQQRLPWACPIVEGQERGYCHRALVLGAGPVGLLGAMAFAAGGFETFVYSLEDEDSEKADLVRSFDGRYVSSKATPVDRLVERMGMIDVVYEATGASKLSFEVLKQVGNNAVFVFTGVPGRRGPVEVDTDFIMRNMVLRNQVVMGTVNAGKDAFEAAIADLVRFKQKWPQAVQKLLTGRTPLVEIASSKAEGGSVIPTLGGIKHVVKVA